MHPLARCAPLSARALTLSLFVSLSMLSCGPGAAYNGAKDHNIQTAQPMEQNGLLDDRLDAEHDPVDWKFFQNDVTDSIFMMFFFDEARVSAEMTLFTGAGNRVASVRHDPSAEFDLLQVPDLREGRYYVKLSVSKGATVYTIRSSTGHMPMLGGAVNSEPRPE
jgi:hypothetical protein